MKKIIIILCISLALISNVIIKAETVFYKDEGSPLTQEEHEYVYQKKLQHQFPTCLDYPEIPYNKNEVEVIQQEIQKKFPYIKVAFIPTMIYEMCFLHLLKNSLDGKTIIVNKDKEIKLLKVLPHFKKNKSPCTSKLSSKLINNEQIIKDCHYVLNNYIPNLFDNKLETLLQVDYEKLLENKEFMYKVWVRYNNNQTNNSTVLPEFDDYIINMMKEVLSLEFKAYQENNFLLYRGSNIIDGKIYDSNQYPDQFNPLSFGSSLFGGVIFDNNFFFHVGACAFSHILLKHGGYILPINKEKYAQQRKIANMFYIPPLASVANLLGKGEIFHPWSKFVIEQSSLTNDEYNKLSNNLYNLLIQGSPQIKTSIYEKIFDYIKKKQIPLIKNVTRTN